MLPGVGQALASRTSSKGSLATMNSYPNTTKEHSPKRRRKSAEKSQRSEPPRKRFLTMPKHFSRRDDPIAGSRNKKGTEPRNVRCRRHTTPSRLFRKDISMGTQSIRRETAGLFPGGRDAMPTEIVMAGENSWANAQQFLPNTVDPFVHWTRTKRPSLPRTLKNAVTTRARKPSTRKFARSPSSLENAFVLPTPSYGLNQIEGSLAIKGN